MSVVNRKMRGLILVGVLVVTAALSPLLPPVESARAESVSLADLSSRAVELLHQDFQTNGARNGDMGVGAYAFYILKTANIDTSGWHHAGISLQNAVIALVKKDIYNPADVSAKQLAQDLLAMKTIQRCDLADQILKILQKRQHKSGFDDNIFSNLAAYDFLGRGGYLNTTGTSTAKKYLLAQIARGADGSFYGWGSYKWKGKIDPGIMSTCQAVRVLSVLDPQKSDPEVQAAIKQGLILLSRYQQSDGSFVAGMDDPAIDSADIIITLDKLGIKPGLWVSGSGKTVEDYMMQQVLNPNGSLGACQNIMDAIWVLDACTVLTSQATAPPVGTGKLKHQGRLQ